MSDNGFCNDCGGTGGHHFNDCSYDGIGSGRNYKRKLPDSMRMILLIAGIIFMGLLPPLGAILFAIALYV